MKHNASYNFISQKVLKATLCTSDANIRIYFEEMKRNADFFFIFRSFSFAEHLQAVEHLTSFLIADLR